MVPEQLGELLPFQLRLNVKVSVVLPLNVAPVNVAPVPLHMLELPRKTSPLHEPVGYAFCEQPELQEHV